MATKSTIEWTDMTWNPVTGCDKISQGCKFCYAERMAKRLKAMGSARYSQEFKVTLHPDLLSIPLKWKKPRIIFVNSMSDLFHEAVPFEFIQKVFETMGNAPRHIFQILTKRSQRLLDLSPHLIWPDNVWMGVSVEEQKTVFRIEDLKNTPARVKFLSCEPLIAPLQIKEKLKGIHWVIVGGESGPGARPMDPNWVIDLLGQCQDTNTPFFFKQWGGVRKKKAGRHLKNQIFNELPRCAKLHPCAHLLFGDMAFGKNYEK